MVAYLADRARIARADRVLDVGCGYGASARWLSRRFDCRVTGITISGAQARLARRYKLRRGYAGRVDTVRADAADPLVQSVCDAFLCPSLASADEYRAWCEGAGLKIHHVEDLSSHVRPTWDILLARTRRPWLAPFRLFLDFDARRFLRGFATMANAYDSRSLSYGLLVASRPQGSPRRRPR